MAKARKTSRRTFYRVHGWMRAVVGRVIRRGFFRIVLALFLIVVVIPFAVLQALANKESGNYILGQVVVEVFDSAIADVSWDEQATVFTGPDLALTGAITYHDIKVTRQAGATEHPRGEPLEYDFLHIPKVEIEYDLKRLPDLPVTTVRIEQGFELYFNIHRGRWLDQELFRTGGEAATAPSLPQIITQGDCQVYLRADGIFVPPETLPAGADWYSLLLRDLSLTPSPRGTEEFVIAGRIDSSEFGKLELGGAVGRKAQRVEVQFRSREVIKFDREYASVLAPTVRRSVEQFQINADADLAGRLLIEPGRELQFGADVTARDGTICFVDFPVRVYDVAADIQVRNNNITVDAIGRRGGASVSVNAVVENVGTRNELLKLNVDIRDLLVDEEFRLALLPGRFQPDNLKDWETGEPYSQVEWDRLVRKFPEELTPGYPEWEGPRPHETDEPILYPEIADALPFVCRAFTPMGLADFDLNFNQEVKGIDPDTGETSSEQNLDFRVYVRGATAAFTGVPEDGNPGFPLPLYNVYGVIEGQQSPGVPGRYEIRGYKEDELARLSLLPDEEYVAHNRRGLAGTIAPDEWVWIYGEFDLPRGPTQVSELRLQFQTEGVDFNERIKQRIPENIREVIEPFAPKGKVDIQRANLSIYPEGDREITYDFNLSAQDVIAQYQFPGAPAPAQFSQVAGTIRVNSRRNEVKLEKVTGRLLNNPISISLTYRDGGLPEFSVESDDFALRPGFTEIMPPGVGAALQRFDPRGHVEFIVTGVRTDQSEWTSAEISFKAGTGDSSGSVRFDIFPYVLTNVSGKFFVNVTEHWTEITLRDFAGNGSRAGESEQPGRVTINGYALLPLDETPSVDEEVADPEAGAGGLVFDLDIKARGVPADNELIAAIRTMLSEPGQEETPALVEFIENLRLSGTFGADGRLVMEPDGGLDWVFEITLEGSGVNFVNFPYPLTDLHGSVLVDGLDVSLRNVEGVAEKGTFTLHSASYSAEQGWQVAVSARDMSFHESPTLMRALPQGLREMTLKLNPVGTFDIDLELSGLGDTMRYDLSLDVFDTAVDLGLHFDGMTARIDMEGVLEGESSRQNGSVYVEEVFFKKARFNDVTTTVQFFDGRVEFPNLRGRFYEGWLEGRFGIEDADYAGEIEIRAANIKQLGETAFPDAGELLGALDGEIRFHSRPDQFGQIGRGRLDISPFDSNSDDPERNSAKLGPVPVISAITAVAGEEHNFDEGHVYFWLGSDRITLREMDIVSDSARIEIFGGDDENYIMYDTTQMRMKMFFTLAPRAPIPLPIVQEVLDQLKKILLPVYVTGTLNAPTINVASLTAEDLDQEEFPRRPRGS